MARQGAWLYEIFPGQVNFQLFCDIRTLCSDTQIFAVMFPEKGMLSGSPTLSLWCCTENRGPLCACPPGTPHRMALGLVAKHSPVPTGVTGTGWGLCARPSEARWERQRPNPSAALVLPICVVELGRLTAARCAWAAPQPPGPSGCPFKGRLPGRSALGLQVPPRLTLGTEAPPVCLCLRCLLWPREHVSVRRLQALLACTFCMKLFHSFVQENSSRNQFHICANEGTILLIFPKLKRLLP